MVLRDAALVLRRPKRRRLPSGLTFDGASDCCSFSRRRRKTSVDVSGNVVRRTKLSGSPRTGLSLSSDRPPNPRLQRTRPASPPSPLSRQPLGRQSLCALVVTSVIALSTDVLRR